MRREVLKASMWCSQDLKLGLALNTAIDAPVLPPSPPLSCFLHRPSPVIAALDTSLPCTCRQSSNHLWELNPAPRFPMLPTLSLRSPGCQEKAMSTQSCFYFFLKILKLFIDSGGRGGERESEGESVRETSICCFTYLSNHWLILVCALTRDQTHNLGISR